MAGLVYPDRQELTQSHEPLTEGEWLVLNVIDFCMVHNWENYVQPHLKELRPDFVALNPGSCVRVYEVKDSNLTRMT